MSYNRSDINLSNCDREPIHIPGSVQPHGALLVVDPASYRVLYASANLSEFASMEAATAFGTDINDIIGIPAAHAVINAGARAGAGIIAGVVLRAETGGIHPTTDLMIHRHMDRLFIELERSASTEDTEVALHLTQMLVRRVNKETELAPLVQSVAALVRAMLGYDRVMVYQFLHNGAGRVIAEARQNNAGSFMGQHFPMSDIPAQARKLYIENWTRVVADVAFQPVPILPHLQPAEAPIDLSYSHLRSVSPIHCEYLTNMGVAASMSISIVIDGQLWGLIACHHNTKKALSIPLRLAAELFAQYFSFHIASIEHATSNRAKATARSKLNAILVDIDKSEPVEFTISRRLRELSSLMPCDGAALWSNGQWFTSGVVPDQVDVAALVEFVETNAGGEIWTTQNLKEALPQSTSYGGRVAGLMALPLSPREGYLFYFRGEEAHEVEWAGEPIKLARNTPAGERLTPRGSFEAWREDVRHKTTPWTADDHVIGEAIRNYIREVLLDHDEATAEQRELRENQRSLLNAELDHRVKNLLALVKSIAIQTGLGAKTVEEYTQSFEGRLRALSFAHDQSMQGKAGGELKELIEAEAAMHRYSHSPNRINLQGSPVGLTERAFGVLALLLHEMMTNAAKYGSLSRKVGTLSISWDLKSDGDLSIGWVERGGPRVSQPTRRGFGTHLIQKTIEHDLSGTAVMDFHPDGLRATISIPFRHLLADAPPHIPTSDLYSVGSELDGLHVLLVEDQALIAMDTEELLKGLGAEAITVASNAQIALDTISAIKLDCAVLDLNLGHETSEIVASHLRQLSIPYIFATGYRDSDSIPARYSGVPVVRKPISKENLAQALSLALTEADNSR